MSEFSADLFQNDVVMVVFAIGSGVLYIVLLSYLLRSAAGRRALSAFRNVARNIFLTDPVITPLSSSDIRLRRLERRIQAIGRAVRQGDRGMDEDRLRIQADEFLAEHLEDMIQQRVQSIADEDSALDARVSGVLEGAVAKTLEDRPLEDLARIQGMQTATRSRHGAVSILESTISEQMASAEKLKRVMINLFVLFNFGVLTIYIVAGGALSDRAVFAIIGLYISLATFIVYIYKTSNARTSVLLALREDAKKQGDVIEFLDRFCIGRVPEQADVDLVKLFMINRAERETPSDHPYELILKEVSNSNIQFKGGRISLSRNT